MTARQLALQGFLLTPIAMAVQGLIALLEEEQTRQQVYGIGRRGQPVKSERYAEKDVSDFENLHQEDQVATELLVTLVLKGFFHGTIHR